ncbi:MAG: hypothetical protein ACYC61_10555 [Isosphaeraceae bacterium]
MDKHRVIRVRDPYLAGAIANREAVLWIGPSFPAFALGEDLTSALRTVLLRRWAAVFIDAPRLPTAGIVDDERQADDLELRYFETEAPGQLPGNRLPFYGLRGPEGAVGPNASDDPLGMFRRLSMLRQMPVDLDVIAVGISGPDDLAGLLEAVKVAPQLRRLTVVAPEGMDLGPLAVAPLDRLTHWAGSWKDFRELIDESTIGFAREVTRLRVRTNARDADLKSVDISGCIDQSYPVTQAFDLIPATAFVKDRAITEEEVQSFLEDPTGAWLPYSEGVPYPRHRPFRESLLKHLRRFGREGHAASFTAWLTADDGSGVTTALHHVCFEVAREGFPVLVARRDVPHFDFSQLSAFLTHASDRMAEEGISVPEVPWVIAFDSEHTDLHWEFIVGACNGLKNLIRSVVIVAVRPTRLSSSVSRLKALGTNRILGGDDSLLTNTITVDEGVSLGEHLRRFLPGLAKLGRSDWERYIGDTVRMAQGDRRSLFWVALRFWLLRLPGAEESLRHWLARKFTDLAGGRPAAYRGLLEVAAMASHRLVLPISLLQPEEAAAIRAITRDSSNALGLRLVRYPHGLGATFTHPQVAEEILRIAMDDSKALVAVDMQVCASRLDLELHLLARVVRRPEAGLVECVPIMEDMVTTALRVDPHEAPRNYQVRDRIVELLEQAPDSLWDKSQLFNHHLAKARRHLAADPPPGDEWTTEARREQLHLAEQHLLDALDHIHPVDQDRAELPLNLRVSLALTYDVRARLEENDGQPDASAKFRRKGEEQYALGMALDADNSYVLENFARFKLWVAEKMPRSADRTRMVVEAIAMLEWERSSNPNSRREEPITLELARAFSLLEDNGGQRYLLDLTKGGNEVALVALARLELRTEEGAPPSDEADEQAEQYLGQVKSSEATWRSRSLLYEIVSRRAPLDFARRLELLRELDDTEFVWPLQLLLESGILMFQVGDPERRREGEAVFVRLRNQLRERSGEVEVPRELKFLRDPKTGFKGRLETSIFVKNTSSPGKSFYGIPHGWQTIDIPFRPHRFGRDRIPRGAELDCYIQFTNFGPQAVPRTEEDE